MNSFCSTMMTSFMDDGPTADGRITASVPGADMSTATTLPRPRLTSMDLGVTGEGVVSPSDLSRTTSMQDMLTAIPFFARRRSSAMTHTAHAASASTTVDPTSFAASTVDAFLVYEATDFEVITSIGEGSISSTSSKSSFNDSTTDGGAIGLQGSPTSRGVSAIIALGRRISDGLPVAIKTLKQRMKAEMKRELRFIELQQQYYTRWPSLGAPRSYANNPATCDGLVAVIGTYAVVETSSIAVVMERMAGSLDALLKSARRPLPPVVVSAILTMALRGVDHMHTNLRMMHRDIKPANLMYDALGTVKLGDFGLCQELDVDTDSQQFVGSATYMAPERLMGARYGAENDVWSLGVVASELLLGYHPFSARFPPQRGGDGAEAAFWSMAAILRFTEDDSRSASVSAVQQYVLTPLREMFGGSSDPNADAAIDFVRRCLLPQAERPACAELQQHPFVTPFAGSYEAARQAFFDFFSTM